VLVSGGIENLSVGYRHHDVGLRDHRRVHQFVAQILAANDFTGGAIGDWTGGIAADAGGVLGELLMIGPGGLAELTLDVPQGRRRRSSPST
jgi:hypothetical protein